MVLAARLDLLTPNPMTENQHTPTPWHVDNSGIVVGSRAPNGSTDLIADLHTSAMPAEARANAALIVRAVNNHQALVEALTKLISWWDFDPNGQLPVGIVNDARAALAAATEGKL